MAGYPAGLGARIAIGLAVLTAVGGCEGPVNVLGTPVNTAGSVFSAVSARRTTGGESEIALQEGVNFSAASYIWQPWFARVRGDTRIAYDKTFGGEGESTLIASVNGSASILPLSRYPVTVGFSHQDSRASGEVSSSDSVSDAAFINASAVLSQTLRGTLSANWVRTDQEDSGVENTRNVNVNVQKTFSADSTIFGIDAIRLTTALTDENFVGSDEEDDGRQRRSASVQLDIDSRPLKDVRLNSTYTAIYDDRDEDSIDQRRTSLQGVSTVQWRPEEWPFIVTGSLRTLIEDIVRSGDDEEPDSGTMLAAGTVGLRWPLSNRLSFNVGLRSSYESIQRDEGADVGEDDGEPGERFNASALAGATYTSYWSEISGFDWQWTASGQTEEGFRSDEGAISNNSVTLGHRFRRMFDDLIFVPVQFSFSQQAGFNYTLESEDPVRVDLLHSAEFDYSGSTRAATTFARLIARDTRTLVGDSREFQVLQGRIGRRVALDTDERLQGDISGQATRTVSGGNAEFSVTASGNAAYSKRNLFEVENLGFRSDLRINVVDLDRVFGESDQAEDELIRNDWRNVLTYRIGRLSADLEATLFQRDIGFGYLAIFRLRRDFGGGQ